MNLAERIFESAGAGAMQQKALIWSPREGPVREYTYGQLYENVNHMAALLASKGIRPGDRIFVYMERSPELYYAVLGIIKCGAVYCPLFSSFGHDAVRDRIVDCGGRVIITQSKYLKNLEGIIDEIKTLELIITADRDTPLTLQPCDFKAYPAADGEIALIHYTSGTTGRSKGAVHLHGAIESHITTGKTVLGLKPGSVYWCTADPAWVTGTSYGIFAPLACGAVTLVCEPGYRIDSFFNIIDIFNVEILYTAPTLIRMLLREDTSKIRKYELKSLKKVLSIGEALPAETIIKFRDSTGLQIHDTWFQTETGSIMLANTDENPEKAGSMGKPVYGIEAAIISDDFQPVAAGVTGHLALKPGWTSMFSGYWGNEEKYRGCFKNGWYITGDLARKDQEGYFWFASREDDVINTAGHLISPFEIEEVLAGHPAAAEVAVTGVPDEITGEKVKAVIVLKDGYMGTPELEMELRALVRRRLAPYASPQVVSFVHEMPKTESGKIIRKKLKTDLYL